MKLKKTFLLASALVITSLPMIAKADLFTTNATNEVSAVKITTGSFKGACTGPLGKFTPANTKNHKTTAVEVKGLCLLSPGNQCVAEIHMAMDCSDASVATATLNLTNDADTVTINSNPSAKYAVTASGNTVTIQYK